MSISFDSALGLHAKALTLRAERTALLASNLANSDTPGFKARDIDFSAALASLDESSVDARLQSTNEMHLQGFAGAGGQELLYRIPSQPSLDGNTVDPHLEKAAFSDNAMRYQASLTFLDQKFKGLAMALRGD